MFNELYAPFYKSIPDSGNYLKRIGLDSVTKADSDTLSLLVLAHQRAVPFENLDIFDANMEIDLGIPALYDKIVLRRRGGYCFELNTIFQALLESLGYECYAVAVRVVWAFSCYMPISHRAIVVTIENQRYFCDVGFGGPSPQGAILLDYDGEQPSGSNVFLVAKGSQYGMSGTIISRIIDGKPEPILLFSETPADQVDFLAPNEYQSRNKHSMFKKDRLINLITETGVITLGGRVLKIHAGGDTIEKSLESEADVRSALTEYFGLAVDYPLNIS